MTGFLALEDGTVFRGESVGAPGWAFGEAVFTTSMAGAALVADVSPSDPYSFSDAGPVRVAVVDYGVKRAILRLLAEAGARVDVFPHDVDADTLAAYDGVLLDLSESWRVSEDGFRSRSTNSWLLGETLQGRVVTTVANGVQVFGE